MKTFKEIAVSSALMAVTSGVAKAGFDVASGTISNQRWASGVPLGGIGCGKLEIMTDGGFGFYTGNNNWDRPTERLKGAFMAVYAESDGRKAARMLRLKSATEFANVANIANVDYTGWFPTAKLEFTDASLPVAVELLAWSPLIPHNLKDSSLPVANFRFRVSNPGDKSAKAVVLMAWPNLVGWGGKGAGWADTTGSKWEDMRGNYQAFEQSGNAASLAFKRAGDSPLPSPNVDGDFLLSVRGAIDGSAAVTLFDAADFTLSFWDAFRQSGALVSQVAAVDPSGALAATVALKPGESREIDFQLVWHMPRHVVTRQVDISSGLKRISTDNVQNVVDGNPGTRWATQRSMFPGDAFIIELPTATNVAELFLDFADAPLDYPRGCQLETSIDGAEWKTVARLAIEDIVKPQEGFVENPLAEKKVNSLTIPLPGAAKIKCLRLTQLGQSWFWWSINQVELRDAAGHKIPAEGWNLRAELVETKKVEEHDQAGHYYSNHFDGARAIADYVYKHYDRLLAGTREWLDLVRESNLPDWLKLKMINASFPIYVVTLLTRDGRFFVQESPVSMGGALGTMDQRMASHAFYIQMFPELDQIELRDFARCQDLVPTADGQIPHFNGNMHEALGSPVVGYGITGWPDLSASWVMQVLKHYRWTGDREFMDNMWPHAQRALAFLKAADKDGDQIPEGGSTYDYEHLPPGAFIYNASCYLGALRAGMAMARIQGDEGMETRYEKQFDATRKSMMEHLWNGKYFHKHVIPANWQTNPNCFIAQLAGDWLSRLSGAGRTLPPAVAKSTISQIIARNVKPFFPVPPMEVSPGGEIGFRACYILQHEPYAGCAAINEGYTDDGLEVLRRVFHVAWHVNVNPWRGSLDYSAPEGSYRGLMSYMTATTTWHVLNALSGSTVDIPAKTLFLSPKVGKAMSELHIPIFFSRFWLWLDYVPGSTLKIKVLKTYGDPVVIDTVTADYESDPVTLPKAFVLKEGETLDLSAYLERLIVEPEPRTVDWQGPRAASKRPGIPSIKWTGEAGSSDVYLRGGPLGKALDGVMDSHWNTWNRAMQPGDWVMVDMHDLHTVGKVVLDSSHAPNDYPRGCTVLISTDGKDWQAVVELSKEACESRQAAGVLEIELPQATPARLIKIVQNGTADGETPWSLNELYLYESQ